MSSLKHSVGSLAALASLAAAPEARAVVVDSLFTSVSLVNNASVSFDVDGDGVLDFGVYASGGGNYAEIYDLQNGNGVVVNEDNYQSVSRLTYGDPISGASIYNGSALFSSFLNAGSSFLGLTFLREGQTHYGWVNVDFTDGDATKGILVSGAWESTAGLGITAGATASAIPEPATTTTIVGGLAAALAFIARRRKQTPSA